MSKCLVIGSMVSLFVAVALCQPAEPPPGQHPPAPAVSSPAPPAGPVSQPPAPVGPPPTPRQPEVVASQPTSPVAEFINRSPEIAFLLSLPGLLGRPFLFLAVFLFIGLVFTRLATRIVLPRVSDAHYAGALDAAVLRKLAISNLLVWALALLGASEAAGLRWLSTLVEAIFGLVGTAIGGLFLVVAATVIAYAISPRGRDFVLGLMGWYCLRYRPSRPTTDQELDLGAGLRGRIVSTDFLHSIVQTADGQQYIIPNARLMKTHYNWGWEDPASPPPGVPSPPQPPPPVDQPSAPGQSS